MIKRVVCLILLVLIFMMIPTNIGASSHPLPSGRLNGEELAMEYAQECQISVERANTLQKSNSNHVSLALPYSSTAFG